MHKQRVPTMRTLQMAIFDADKHITRAEQVADTLNQLSMTTECGVELGAMHSSSIYLLSTLLHDACKEIRETLDYRKVCELHPLEVLKKDFMEPQSIEMDRMAKDLDLCPRRFKKMFKRRRELPKSVLLKLADRFDTEPEYWTELQQSYRICETRKDRERRQRMKRKRPVRRTLHD